MKAFISKELYYLRPLFIRLLAVLLIYAGLRWLFYVINTSTFPDLAMQEVVRLSFVGVRFDLVPLLYVNALFILLSLLPIAARENKGYQRFQKILFVALNAVAFSVEFINIPYFQFSGRRMIRSDVSMWWSSSNLTGNYLMSYWYLLLLWGLLIYLLYKVFEWTQSRAALPAQRLGGQWVIFILAIGFSVLGIRGGIQLRPLMPLTAASYVQDMRLMPLISSTGLSLIFSLSQKQLSPFTFYEEADLNKTFKLTRNESAKGEKVFRPQNVLIITLESMSNEYVGWFGEGPSYTPFLDSLLQEGYSTDNGLANGMRSTQGIVAITSSIPALMEDPLMFSAYQGNQVEGMANLLKRKGYQTAFFHGANPGSMAFEKFAELTGFEAFYDKSNYEGDLEKDDDGHWGIWDDPFFQFTAQKLNELEPPFYGFLFSLSSHHPYIVPPAFAAQYPDDPPDYRSVRYTDEALRHFFETIREMPWYKETLFVITADHIGSIKGGSPYHNSLGYFKVPLLFYHPTDRIDGRANRLIQHIDIQPSILDYLQYDEAYSAFGQSCFDSTITPYAYMRQNDLYQIVDTDFVYLTDLKDIQQLYHVSKDPLLKKNVIKKFPKVRKRLDQRLKAVLQRHHRAMIRNELVE